MPSYLLAFKSHAIAYILGIITGAGGSYLADKFTDQRRHQEASRSERNRFRSVYKQVPELIDEMRADFRDKTLTREFIIASKSWVFGGGLSDVFIYHFETHPELESKIHLLENNGYVFDVTTGNTKKFRFSEDFVALLQSEITR